MKKAFLTGIKILNPYVLLPKFLNTLKTPVGILGMFAVFAYVIVLVLANELEEQKELNDRYRGYVDNLIQRNAEQQIELEEQRTIANVLQDDIWIYRDHMQKEATE